MQFVDNLNNGLVSSAKKLSQHKVVERLLIYYNIRIYVAINSHVVNDATDVFLLH